MDIVLATLTDLDTVRNITTKTIKMIYPHYYPQGVVEFFLDHHNKSNILRDIINNNVYLVREHEIYIGTVTLGDNEINRLFVLPEYQKKGYGRCLMDFSEELLFKTNKFIKLHASLPGKSMYIKRGYKEIQYYKKEVAYNDWICVDIMEKSIE